MTSSGRSALDRLLDVLDGAPRGDPRRADAWSRAVLDAATTAAGADAAVVAWARPEGSWAGGAAVGPAFRQGWEPGTPPWPGAPSASCTGADVATAGGVVGHVAVARRDGPLATDAAALVRLVAVVLGTHLDAAAAAEGSRRPHRLAEVGAGLARHLDLTAVATAAVDGVAEALAVATAALWTRSGAGGHHLLVASGQAGQTRFVDDADWARATRGARRLAPGVWTGSDPTGGGRGDVVVVALGADDHLLISPAVAALAGGDDAVAALSSFAARAGTALANARRHATLRREAHRTAELLRYARAVTRWLDLDAVYDRTARLVEQTTTGSSLTLLEVDADEVHVIGDHLPRGRRPGPPSAGSAAPVEPRTVPLDGPLRALAGRVIVDGAVHVDDAAAEPALAGLLPPSARSLLVAGHVEENRLAFALVVTGDRPFDADDERFARDLVELAASAVRNARLLAATRREAERDSLTGLRNRAAFWHELRRGVAAADGTSPFALAVVDVDDFKQVNDRFGHPVGDQVLVTVAERLRRSVRETDHIYRVGGEEFALLIPEADAAAALRVLRRALARVKRGRADLPSVTVSAGAAVTTGDLDATELYRLADAALYRAKHAGKDRVEVAYPSERSAASTSDRSGASTTTA